MNNLPPRTAVTGSSRERRTVLQVNYSASMDQVRRAAIHNSVVALYNETLKSHFCAKINGMLLFRILEQPRYLSRQSSTLTVWCTNYDMARVFHCFFLTVKLQKEK